MSDSGDQPSDGLRYVVTLAEIADLFAGRSRSAVSNWRDRYAGFPEPLTPGRSPVFDVAAVLSWIDSSDSPVQRGKTPGSRWWWDKAVEAFRVQFAGLPTRPYLVAWVLLHAALVNGIDGIDPEPDRWNAVVDGDNQAGAVLLEATRLEEHHESLSNLLVEPLSALPVTSDVVRELARRLHGVAKLGRSSAVLRDVLDGVETPATRRSPASATRAELATMMARVAGIADGDTVFDPAAGEAGTLVAAAARRRERDIVLYGQELDPATWRIGRTRLLLAGIRADLGEPGRDSITDDQWPDVRADVVLVDPPLDREAPPLRAWVMHVFEHLTPGGRGVIAIPASAVVNVRAARRQPSHDLVEVLREFANRGQVESVVVLPRRLRSDVAGPMTLWTVRSTPQPRDVQVIETPAAASELHASTQPLEAVQTNEVVSVIERWRTKVVAVTTPRVKSRAVPRHELMPYLQEAVKRVEHGPAERSVAQSHPTDSSDRDRDEVARYKNENAALKTQVRKLLTVLEPHLEKIWEIDRNAFFELREEINALRRM